MSARWLRAFREDAWSAVTDLFTGRAGVGSDMRLDVPELLRQLFPRTLSEERARLDDALLAWLLEARESYASQVERLGFAVYGKRVGDALIALQLLDLPYARGQIRESMDAWLRWLSPLRLAPERDPALECLRLLTRDQPDGRHIALWLRLAADGRAEYLTVALAGLQDVPNGNDARKNQVLMLQGLLRHAITNFHEVNGAKRSFNRGFGVVRALYPRNPKHWRGVLEEALPKFQLQVRSQLAKDLADELRRTQLGQQGRVPPYRMAPVPEGEWKALLTDIRNDQARPEELAGRLFAMAQKNDDYALKTGDGYHFVSTLCNLGSEMLERHELGASDMDQLGTMIERALAWEQFDPYCWMLWARWHQAQGRRSAEEAILREMVRMFPYNPPAQVQLARLLIRQGEGHWREAEHYLQRVKREEPGNGHVHVVLVRLRCLQGRQEEAEETLLGFLAGDPQNEEARDFLRQLQAGGRGDPLTFSNDAQRDVGQGDDASGCPAPAASALQEVLRRGSLAVEFSRALVANGDPVQTPRIRQESREGDALAGFYSQWLRLDDTPACPPYAWAWDACRLWQRAAPAEDWRGLADRFPEAAAQTDLLCGWAWPKSATGESANPHEPQGDASAHPMDNLMRKMPETPIQHRGEAARALMACAAAEVPQFAISFD